MYYGASKPSYKKWPKNLPIKKSQGDHVDSSRTSIPATQVWLPPGENTTEKNDYEIKFAFNEQDSQGVIRKQQKRWVYLQKCDFLLSSILSSLMKLVKPFRVFLQNWGYSWPSGQKRLSGNSDLRLSAQSPAVPAIFQHQIAKKINKAPSDRVRITPNCAISFFQASFSQKIGDKASLSFSKYCIQANVYGKTLFYQFCAINSDCYRDNLPRVINGRWPWFDAAVWRERDENPVMTYPIKKRINTDLFYR